MSRFNPSVDVTHISPNVSSRFGRRPKLIVIHATISHNRPGVSDLRTLGQYFGTRSSKVSCHVATDAEGNSGRYVHDEDKAWQCAFYNGVALGIEQVWIQGETWHLDGIRETARWVAYWGKKWNIPIRRGAVFGGIVTKPGVVTHKQLGRLGGGHVDPPDFPFRTMLSKAQWYRSQM